MSWDGSFPVGSFQGRNCQDLVCLGCAKSWDGIFQAGIFRVRVVRMWLCLLCDIIGREFSGSNFPGSTCQDGFCFGCVMSWFESFLDWNFLFTSCECVVCVGCVISWDGSFPRGNFPTILVIKCVAICWSIYFGSSRLNCGHCFVFLSFVLPDL